MTTDPKYKMIDKDHIEKYILRKAFDTSGEGADVKPYLPEEILWRQKEQFSDGVGYSWIDGLKDAAEAKISDEQFKIAKPEWGSDIPTTKEAYWYRCLFDEIFLSQLLPPLSCAGFPRLTGVATLILLVVLQRTTTLLLLTRSK